MRRPKSLGGAADAALALLVSVGRMAIASPPSGGPPTVLARGTYDSFKVMSNPEGPAKFKAESKEPIDIVVRRHEYAAGGSTGWHAHPFPVFLTVLQGRLTFYEYDDQS